MNKYLLLVIGLGGAVAAFFLLRRGSSATTGSRAVDHDLPVGGPLTGKIDDVGRSAFTGFTFNCTITNPSNFPQVAEIGITMVPSGGFQFGVDTFDARRPVAVPARSSVGVAFTDDDFSVAPFGGSGTITLTIDGKVVDEQT